MRINCNIYISREEGEKLPYEHYCGRYEDYRRQKRLRGEDVTLYFVEAPDHLVEPLGVEIHIHNNFNHKIKRKNIRMWFY